MKKTAVFTMIILFLVAGIALAKDYEVNKKAGDYDVVMKINRNPPVVGDNNISIEVKDASGHHAGDAKVVVEYSMPSMPGMPASNFKTDAERKGNEYRAKMNLSMSGSWNIAVKITRAGKTSTMKFIVDAT